jgi:hypothetical protein
MIDLLLPVPLQRYAAVISTEQQQKTLFASSTTGGFKYENFVAFFGLFEQADKKANLNSKEQP